MGMILSEFFEDFLHHKSIASLRLLFSNVYVILFSHYLGLKLVTDRRTDRQTDTR